MISLGNIKAKAVYYGSLAIKAVYAGAVKVWEKVAGLKNYIIKGNAEVVDGKVKGVGDEFAFNQLVQNGDFSNGLIHWGTTRVTASITDKVATITFVETVNGERLEQSGLSLPSHKYLYAFGYSADKTTTRIQFVFAGQYLNHYSVPSGWNQLSGIVTASSVVTNFNISFNAQTNAFAVGDSVKVKAIQLFDLTAMGIADRVNSLADFKAYLVERGMMQSVDDELPYFAYDAGSTKTSMPLKVMSGSTKVATYPCLLTSPLYKVGNVADTADYATQRITRGMGRVKAKDLSWYDHSGFGMLLFYAEISNKAANSNYLFASLPIGSWPPADGRSFSDNTRMWARDSAYTDAASFKAHFSDDDYIIYELATPVEESAVLPAVTEWQDGYILTTDTEIAPSEVTTEV